jgi:cobalt-zinc-cadmium efflux system outer membrane protein
MRANVLAMVLCANAFAQNSLTLADLERMALAASPSIKERVADVQAAAGRARQAGFYPNPVLGASGDHVAGGPIQRGGDLGGFVEQRVVTAGKLGLARRAGDQMRQAAEQAQAAEQLRVLTAIRGLYYQALGEQRLIAIRSDLAELAERAAKTRRELANLGQADQPDVLTADVEAQRAQLAVSMARNALAATWQKIAAMAGRPDLRPAVLDGDWEALPKLEETAERDKIYAASPQLRAAQANRAAADLRLRRERAEAIPDVMLRGGVRDNRALVGTPASTNLVTPAGIEGFFDVGVQVPLFHRNQGNVAASAAESEHARFDELRERQALAVRFAEVYRGYRDAADRAARYRESMLPAARQAYEMYLTNFGNMAAPYLQVLLTQRTLFQLEEEYVAAVMAGWSNVVEMEGLLANED